jgi:hypothetical protein
MAGPNIIVSGVNRIIVQTLTDYISVTPRSNHNERSPLDDAGYRVARLFRALGICVTDLCNYYEKVVQDISAPLAPSDVITVMGASRSSTGASSSPRMIGPHFLTYRNNVTEKVTLEYKMRLTSQT